VLYVRSQVGGHTYIGSACSNVFAHCTTQYSDSGTVAVIVRCADFIFFKYRDGNLLICLRRFT